MSTGFVLKARPAWAGAPRSRAPHDGGGPDWVRVAAAGEGRVAAGPWFALYARSTPAAPQAAQAEAPMVLDHFALAHVGRVDNRAEVAERAGRPELARAGDGLVLAAAYARWGASLPAHVLGEYAFVVVDRRHESVVGASDSLGIYPLFYAQRGGALVVASCLSLLLDALGDVPPLDARAIEEYLAFGGAIASVRTLYAGVRRVATGCALTRGGAGEVREQRVWRPDPKAPPVRSSDELDEALRALLGDAVRAAARSNGRVCSDLSGGLDSSTVTAMAAQLRERGELDTEIAAFSIVHTRTARSDESAFQRAVLERYRLQQVVLDGDACVALDEPGFGAEGAVRRPGAPSFNADVALRRSGAREGDRSGGAARRGAPPRFCRALPRRYRHDRGARSGVCTGRGAA
jgi:asparagine synthetase B (glutamine-hydrolysing)